MLLARGWRAVVARASAAQDRPTGTGNALSEHPAPLATARAATPLPLLWVDEHLPDPGRDSGSLRMFNLLRLLVAMGHSVDVLATSGRDTAQQRRLTAIGVGCIIPEDSGGPARWFLRWGDRYAAVIVSRYHLANQWFPLIRHVRPDALKVLDTVDLHHVRELREAELRGSRLMRLAARATRRRELNAVRAADVTWVVSEVERRMLAKTAPDARVEVISNVHDLPSRAPRPRSGAHLVFVGGAQHPPNADGVSWLLTDILPRILHRLPHCRLHLVGRDLEDCAGGSASHSNVVFHGRIEDLGELFASCHVGLAPLRFGAGVKGKINHYMAFGLPTVATPSAVEGMHLEDGRDVIIASDAAAFADAVVRLLDDPVLWSELSLAGQENVRRHFSMESAAPGLRSTFEHCGRALAH